MPDERRRLRTPQPHLARQRHQEDLGYASLAWAERIVGAVLRKPFGSGVEVLAGTVQHAGKLESVIRFLDAVSSGRCDCKARFLEDEPDGFWGDEDYEHHCHPRAARSLIQSLRTGDATDDE